MFAVVGLIIDPTTAGSKDSDLVMKRKDDK
ncbi:TPA: phage holin [Listeria innocua]